MNYLIYGGFIWLGIMVLASIVVAVYEYRDDHRECDHTFWPVKRHGNYVGQRCSICGKFNSIEEVVK